MTQPKKAKNPQNQESLDKLLEVYEKASANPNSNYVFTLRRAMKSLQQCPTAVTTQKEACALKYVGPSIAKIICPVFLPSPTAASTFMSISNDDNNHNNNNHNHNNNNNKNRNSRKRSRATTTANNTDHQGLTKKEKIYQQERLAAESLDLSTCGPWKVILIIDGREHRSQHVVSKCKQSGIPCEERTLPIGDMAWIAQSQDRITGRTMEVLCGTIIERKESSDLAASLFGTRYLEQRMRLKSCGVPQLLLLVEGSLAININCPQETLKMAIMETRCLGFHVLQTENLQDTVRKLKGLHRRVLQRTFPEAFSQLPTYTRSPTGTFGLHRKRRPSSLLEMTFDTTPKPALGAKRFITYTELKAKVELDRETGTKTVGAIYMAMLKQVSTLSHKKCEALANMYPTMNSLLTAYATSDDPAKLIQDVPLGRQKMGPKSSEAVYLACCTRRDGTLPSGPTMDLADIPVAKSATAPPPPTATNTTVDAYFAPTTASPPKATAADAADAGATTTTAVPSSALAAVVSKKPASRKAYFPPLPDRKPICVDLTEDSPIRPVSRKKASSYYSEDPPSIGSTSSSSVGQKSNAAALKFSPNNNNNNDSSQEATPKATPKTAVQLDFSSPLFSSPDELLNWAPPFAKRHKTTTALDVTALARSASSTSTTTTTTTTTPSPAAAAAAAASTSSSSSSSSSSTSGTWNPSSSKKKPSALAVDVIHNKPSSIAPSILVIDDSSSDEDDEDDDDLLAKKRSSAPSAVAAKAAATTAAVAYSIPSSAPTACTVRQVSAESSPLTDASSSSSSFTTSEVEECQEADIATCKQHAANVTIRANRDHHRNSNTNYHRKLSDLGDGSSLEDNEEIDENDNDLSLDLLPSRLAKRSKNKPTETIIVID